MPLRNRFFLASLLVLLIVTLAIALAPIMISNGIRLWVWWFARQEGFVATIDKIEAPFLRPIVIHEFQLKSSRDDALRVDITAMDARVTLNLKHILLRMGGRDIRNVSVRELRAEIHRTNPNVRALNERAWATLHRLLPESMSIAKLEMRVENGPTLILLRNAFLSASETEPGRFSTAELMITSPWVRQTFSQVRGATCSPPQRISHVWGISAWDYNSTSMLLAENSVPTFRTSGTRDILTGRLQAGPRTFRWRKSQARSGSRVASMVYFTPATSHFAATWPNQTVRPPRSGAS